MNNEIYRWSAKSYWAFIFVQFQGAFNDNAFRLLLVTAALATAVSLEQKNLWSSVIALVFIIPFILFSMHGGYFADRYSKRSVIITVKWVEVLIMLLAALSFLTGQLWITVAILFFMGMQSAYFGPSKYGIIPELIYTHKLSWANGVIQLTTFIAIIFGTFMGTVLKEVFHPRWDLAMYLLAGLSLTGTIISYYIDKIPAAAPSKKLQLNFLGDLVKNIKIARQDNLLWLAIIGNIYFWFLGMVLMINIPVYGDAILGLSSSRIGVLLVAISFGIGLGSYATGHLSSNKIEYGFIPFGTILMTLISFYIYYFTENYQEVIISLGLLGFASGFYIVPINTVIQHRPAPDNKGGILGMSYLLNNIGLILAIVFFYFLTTIIQIQPQEVFLVCAIFTLFATAYIFYLIPDSLLRLFLWLLTRTLYKITIIGRENIPIRNGALFVSNNFTFMGALFLIASTDRFVRFIMPTQIYNKPGMKLLANILCIIPMPANADTQTLRHAITTATKYIKAGDIVCLLADEELTSTEQILPFFNELKTILKEINAPVIPIYLNSGRASLFTDINIKCFWEWYKQIPYPITLNFGKPQKDDITMTQIQQAVQKLAPELFKLDIKDMQPLHHAFIRIARRFPFRYAMADLRTPQINFNKVLIRTIIIANKMQIHWKGQEMVGIIMPSSVAGACLNIAALLAGKIPVNLNFTSSAELIKSAIEQCEIKTVVTARAFTDKVKIDIPVKTIYLEDLVPQVTRWDKISALLKSWFYPISMLEKSVGSTKNWNIDDLATVIFSSGSTGDPKGVMLTHLNIYSNIQQVVQVLFVNKTDKIVGILPFFHSFGFTGTLWLPMLKGFGVVYHPNPTDALVIGELISKYKATILCTTPTFLQNYYKRVEPELFNSLRYIIVGAERLSDRLATSFEEKFGIRPFEAYGCTECSPAVSINSPSYNVPGKSQISAKRGSIGPALPGLEIKIVDPDSFEPLPIGKSGLLLVKGHNVTKGYLGKETETQKAFRDGWYITGDIVTMDADGFLFITDRLNRFAKIGGEMIPLIKVEEKLQSYIDTEEQAVLVSSVPDEIKGEKLVVLHRLEDDKLNELFDKLKGCDLPNLWIPKKESFYKIDTIPVLGTGKLDLRKIKQLAEELTISTGK